MLAVVFDISVAVHISEKETNKADGGGGWPLNYTILTPVMSQRVLESSKKDEKASMAVLNCANDHAYGPLYATGAKAALRKAPGGSHGL
jgi:hypothetical protein